MKTIRTWLLVLLAVLLPIRGTVAAAMLCSSAEPGSATEWAVPDSAAHHHPAALAAQPAHHEHQHDGHPHVQRAAGADAAGAHAAEQHLAGGFEKCNLCCDFCSVTPLSSALPSVPTPPDPGRVSFPDPVAAAASFLSDGQERPPRSS